MRLDQVLDATPRILYIAADYIVALRFVEPPPMDLKIKAFECFQDYPHKLREYRKYRHMKIQRKKVIKFLTNRMPQLKEYGIF